MPVQKSTNPVNDLSEKFVGLYGIEAQFVEAPGRVNLIGEHTDYNDRFVLPAAKGCRRNSPWVIEKATGIRPEIYACTTIRWCEVFGVSTAATSGTMREGFRP